MGTENSARFPLSLFVVALVAMFAFCASCEQQTPASTEVLECGGVEISDPDLVMILDCAGWLDFVIENVTDIEFVNAAALEFEGQEVLGLAFCAECKISIPVLEEAASGKLGRRSDLDIARLIVHEAAHLADDCRNGETPALEAERAFLVDFNFGNCRN